MPCMPTAPAAPAVPSARYSLAASVFVAVPGARMNLPGAAELGGTSEGFANFTGSKQRPRRASVQVKRPPGPLQFGSCLYLTGLVGFWEFRVFRVIRVFGVQSRFLGLALFGFGGG